MQWLLDLLQARRDDLVRRIYDKAEANRYTRYTAQGLEAWSGSVQGLIDAFRSALGTDGVPCAWGPDDEIDPDNPVSGFGILEARRHRARGVSLPMFLGLFKLYRYAWHEVVAEGQPDCAVAHPAHRFIDSFFDTVELGICGDWSQMSFPGQVAEVQEANRSLIRQVARWRTLFDGLGEAVFLLDSAGRLQSINQAAYQRFIGAGPSGLDRCGLAFAEAVPALGASMNELANRAEGEAQGRYTLDTLAGPRIFDVRLRPVRSIGGMPTGTLLVLRDETEWVRAEQESEDSRRVSDEALRTSVAQLEFQALHDALTGLPNRVLFLDRMNQGIAVARRRAWYHYAVLFMDLDRFKIVNDSLGHPAGDQLLRSVARRIAECLRPGDTVARVGGDEFAVLLSDLRDVGDASVVAERILAQVAQPVMVGDQEFLPNVSIGIAHSGAAYERGEDVLRDADTAMYRAKSLGRGQTVVFDRQMHNEVAQRLTVEAELRRAVEQKEFVVFYQPIVSIPGGVLTGFEALVRWNDPTRGIRSPMDFIHVAEETGLIVPMGEYVLNEACRQAAEWASWLPEQRRPTISVNFSVRQFASGVALAEVHAALASTGLDAKYLKVEITESILMEDSKGVHEQLNALAALGVQLQMDDFGTGYSSLAYLHRFPIDVIKVDRSFVSQVHAVARGEVVKTIVLLARSLEMGTIAEGVETVEQLGRLCHLQCDYAQGYLFSRPVDAAAATRLLKDGTGWADLMGGAGA